MRDEDAQTLHEILTARGGFGHREHLELAWTYLSRHSAPAAERAMTAALRDISARHGMPERYHETLTRAWCRVVALHRGTGDETRFDDFIAANPGLLDRDLLRHHYSRQVLFSQVARDGWIAPDLQPFPAAL